MCSAYSREVLFKSLIEKVWCLIEVIRELFLFLLLTSEIKHVAYESCKIKPDLMWKVRSEKDTCSCFLSYRIIILRNSCHFWFKNPSITKIWSPLSQQPWAVGSGEQMCFKEKTSGNKIVSQVFNFYFVQR